MEPSEDPARDTRPSSSTRWIASLGVLAVGVVIVAAQGRHPDAPRALTQTLRPAASDTAATGDAAVSGEFALLAPLAVGARLSDGVIVSIAPAQRGLMHVYVRSGGRTFDLGVGLARADLTGLRAGRYAVYILGSSRPEPRAFPLADALARRIRANGDVPPPPGLSEAQSADAGR